MHLYQVRTIYLARGDWHLDHIILCRQIQCKHSSKIHTWYETWLAELVLWWKRWAFSVILGVRWRTSTLPPPHIFLLFCSPKSTIPPKRRRNIFFGCWCGKYYAGPWLPKILFWCTWTYLLTWLFGHIVTLKIKLKMLSTLNTNFE